MTQMTTRSWQALPDTQRWWAEQPERIAQRLGLQHDIASIEKDIDGSPVHTPHNNATRHTPNDYLRERGNQQ